MLKSGLNEKGNMPLADSKAPLHGKYGSTEMAIPTTTEHAVNPKLRVGKKVPGGFGSKEGC